MTANEKRNGTALCRFSSQDKMFLAIITQEQGWWRVVIFGPPSRKSATIRNFRRSAPTRNTISAIFGASIQYSKVSAYRKFVLLCVCLSIRINTVFNRVVESKYRISNNFIRYSVFFRISNTEQNIRFKNFEYSTIQV